MFRQTFLEAEPRRNGMFSKSKQKRVKHMIRQIKPLLKHRPKYKISPGLNIKTTETFEEWIERIRGYPTLQRRMDRWLKVPNNHERLFRGRGYTRPRVLAFVTFLLMTWGFVTVAGNDDALAEVLREDNVPETLNNHQKTRVQPLLMLPSVKPPAQKSGSQKRQEKRDWRNKRISDKLLDIYKARERRMPAAKDGIFNNRDKWLRYLTGSLESDNEILERELEATDQLLVQMYDLVDANHDGAGDGMRKRQYMVPVLKPMIYDLALHALKADFAFTNATFHKKLYNDHDSRVIQKQRIQKIVKTLAIKADLSSQDITQLTRTILTRVDDNPVLWYDSHEPVLYGKGMVKFLRDTTKNFVHKSIRNIPEESRRTDIEEILHVAAIIDASTSGRKLRATVQERQATDDIAGALYSYNPMGKHVLRHYESFLEDQLRLFEEDSPSENAVNSLLRRIRINGDTIVKDVRLLWTIYDEESEKTFSVSETTKHDNMAKQFLGNVLRDLREKDATYRGRDEGRERLMEELEKLEKVAYKWGVTVLVGILGIVFVSSKMGCRSCFSSCSSCKNTCKDTCKGKACVKSKASPKDKDKVRDENVLRFGSSDKLWIFVEDQNAYRRITKRGHPDFYTVMRTGIMSSDNKKAQNPIEAGRINTNSKYIQ